MLFFLQKVLFFLQKVLFLLFCFWKIAVRGLQCSESSGVLRPSIQMCVSVIGCHRYGAVHFVFHCLARSLRNLWVPQYSQCRGISLPKCCTILRNICTNHKVQTEFQFTNERRKSWRKPGKNVQKSHFASRTDCWLVKRTGSIEMGHLKGVVNWGGTSMTANRMRMYWDECKVWVPVFEEKEESKLFFQNPQKSFLQVWEPQWKNVTSQQKGSKTSICAVQENPGEMQKNGWSVKTPRESLRSTGLDSNSLPPHKQGCFCVPFVLARGLGWWSTSLICNSTFRLLPAGNGPNVLSEEGFQFKHWCCWLTSGIPPRILTKTSVCFRYAACQSKCSRSGPSQAYVVRPRIFRFSVFANLTARTLVWWI